MAFEAKLCPEAAKVMDCGRLGLDVYVLFLLGFPVREVMSVEHSAVQWGDKAKILRLLS